MSSCSFLSSWFPHENMPMRGPCSSLWCRLTHIALDSLIYKRQNENVPLPYMHAYMSIIILFWYNQKHNTDCNLTSDVNNTCSLVLFPSDLQELTRACKEENRQEKELDFKLSVWFLCQFSCGVHHPISCTAISKKLLGTGG